MQCHERKLTFHYTGTGNLAPKKRIQWNRYHYYIRQSGEVVNTRPLSRISAHTKGFNRNSIGICYEGGLDKDGKPKDTRTPEQRTALRQLVDELLARFPNCKVCGHRDLSPDLNRNGRIEPHEWTKQCPCFDVATKL